MTLAFLSFVIDAVVLLDAFYVFRGGSDILFRTLGHGESPVIRVLLSSLLEHISTVHTVVLKQDSKPRFQHCVLVLPPESSFRFCAARNTYEMKYFISKLNFAVH